jgi:hypothetical protein
VPTSSNAHAARPAKSKRFICPSPSESVGQRRRKYRPLYPSFEQASKPIKIVVGADDE